MDSYTMTPADMRAVTDGARDDGFGMGGGWMWIIVLFLFLFGFGGGAWGNRGQGLTQMEMQQGLDTQEIVRKLDGINYGLCDSFYAQNTTMLNGFGRTPHGVRGLKSPDIGECEAFFASHPARGAWIEIRPLRVQRLARGSHPARGAWIEIVCRIR